MRVCMHECICVHVCAYVCTYVASVCVCMHLCGGGWGVGVRVCASHSTALRLPCHPVFVRLSPFLCGYSRAPTRLNVSCPALLGLHDSRLLPSWASLQRQGGYGLAISTKGPFVQQGAEYIVLLLTVVLGTVQGVEFPPRPTQEYPEIVCVALQSPV